MPEDKKKPKTIVISGVNLNVGGTLTILRECLKYLSQLASNGNYKVIAIVYQKELAFYPHIEYIESQWPKKKWINRLWFEYVSMHKISKQIGPIHLWLSLHDTSPNIIADRKAVYCHNPFPFYNWKWQECVFAPKIVLFALFSKYIYQKNIHQNSYVIVQQNWLRKEFNQRFNISEDQIIVAVPDTTDTKIEIAVNIAEHAYQFLFPASANSHKNFEIICQAAEILETEEGIADFKVKLTISGTENAYARWIKKQWGHLKSLEFIGFVKKDTLDTLYQISDCLIFPSKVETWGLPITEFARYNKPMLLAKLPYALETASGCKKVAFFEPDLPNALASQMKNLIEGRTAFLTNVQDQQLAEPFVKSWSQLFNTLLK